MKKIVMLVVALVLASSLASGQSILERLRQKGREVIENAVTGGANQQEEQPEQPAEEVQEAPEQQQPATQAAPKKQVESAYAKSDFVPGDEIFFEDTFEQEQLGEFPSQWDLLSGYAEVGSFAGRKVIAFTDDGQGCVIPLMKEPRAFLPEVFTLEYDVYLGEPCAATSPCSTTIRGKG